MTNETTHDQIEAATRAFHDERTRPVDKSDWFYRSMKAALEAASQLGERADPAKETK